MPRKPARIQRKRSKGWRMPDGAVYVGRPSRWGNPYKVSGATTPLAACELYRDYLRRAPDQDELRLGMSQLRGRDLACWCPLDQPCHADVLLELANARKA